MVVDTTQRAHVNAACGHAAIDQRAKDHVAGGTRETVEVEDAQVLSILSCSWGSGIWGRGSESADQPFNDKD